MIRMPVIFAGHGSPTNAIENNEFSHMWEKIGKEIHVPDAILSVSAHWYIKGTKVTAMDKPKTIHDFYGFQEELYKVEYPAPGSEKLAGRVIRLAGQETVKEDLSWGLDHGTWSVLRRMFPEAKIPVVQLSIDYSKNASWHYDFGKKLLPLRDENILIFASGNIVHNLGKIIWEDRAYDWAVDFDNHIKESILNNDIVSIINYQKYGDSAALSVPTNDHYLPMLYALGAKQQNDSVSFFCEKTTFGAISMRGFVLQEKNKT